MLVVLPKKEEIPNTQPHVNFTNNQCYQAGVDAVYAAAKEIDIDKLKLMFSGALISAYGSGLSKDLLFNTEAASKRLMDKFSEFLQEVKK